MQWRTGSGNVYCGDSIVDGDFDSPPVRALGSGLILTGAEVLMSERCCLLM